MNNRLRELTNTDFAAIDPSLDGGVRSVLSVAGALAGRTTVGGTAPTVVLEQLSHLTDALLITEKTINKHRKAFSEMMSQ